MGLAAAAIVVAGAAVGLWAGRARTRPATPRAPGLMYLGWWDSAGAPVRELYLAAMDGSGARQLTRHAAGVWDYAVNPADGQIVYSAVRDDGGSDLWRMNPDGGRARLAVECPGEACLAPAWSPDGRTIAYERRGIYGGGPNLDPRAGRIWLWDVARRRSRPLFDYDVPLHSPVWAPDSRRLAYVSPLGPSVEVVDVSTGEIVPFDNEWGMAPAWSPDGTRLAVSDLAIVDDPAEAMVVHLFQIDLATRQATNLTSEAGGAGGPLLVKDTGPAWSPGGGWIAFGRQAFEGDQATPGRQIWLARPAGGRSEAYALVREPMADLFGAVWRPDGGALAYLSADLAAATQAQPQVSVWVFDFETRRSARVADGVMPRWVP